MSRRCRIRPCASTPRPRHEKFRDQPGPPGLMWGPGASAGVAAEELIERDAVSIVRIRLKLWILAQDGTVARPILQKQPRQPARQLGGHLLEAHQIAGAGGAFDLEVIAVVVMEFLQRFDEEEVHRKPDGAAPIRVAAEYPAVRLGGNVANREIGHLDSQKL